MDNMNNKREDGVRKLDNEELKDVVGGEKGVITPRGTCNMQCKGCKHRTAHQMNRFGKWECIICGTIND